MEGPKRLQLTTMAPVAQPEKKPVTPKTFRFELDITDPTDGTCPEYFFTELQKSTTKSADTSRSDDPFGDDDADKLAEIARAYEAKYNKPSDGKKKKKKWRDNYYLEQLADGYDENDTFIDNSEAYDEVLPETYTTKHGGFYINSGGMEIKEMSDASDEEFRSPMPIKKNKKKRRISSGEDSDGEQKVAKKKKIKDTLSVDGEVKKKKKKKLIIAPGEKGFKKPKPQDKTNGKSPGNAGLVNSAPPSMNGDSHENGVISSDGEDNSRDSKSNISMVIDSVIAMGTTSNDTENSELEEPKKEIDLEKVPKLPPNMPTGTEEKVERLKAHAKETSDGKCKFFTTNVNKLLLEVELASKQMTVSNRSAVFGHLAAFLPCSKDTLMKRAKNLRVKELEDKIKEPLDKLKQALNAMMPAMIEKYDEDCKKAAQEKLEDGNKETPKVDKEGGKEDAATESDEDDKTNQSDSVKKRPTGPRKKFAWNNEIRGLLCDVVRVKMHSFSMLKGKAQSAEEFCKAFLETDVRPLWPKGWMQTRVLFKESKSAHTPWTNPQKKKIFTVTKNAMPATSMISKTPTNTSVSSANSSASKMPYLSVTKVTSGTTVVKSVNVNSNKGNMNTPVNPSAASVKVDKIYANTPTGVSSVSNNSGSASKNSQQTGNLPSPSIIRMSDIKTDGSTPKQAVSKTVNNSWNHMVSDILRSSMSEQPSGKSPPQPILQRQNSNPLQVSQSNASGFMAQFMKHIATGDVSPKQISPPQKMQDSIMSQHNKYLQQLEAEKLKLYKESEKMKETKVMDALIAAQQHVSSKGSNSGQKQTASISGQARVSQSPLNLVMSRAIPSGQSNIKMTAKQSSSGQFLAELSHKNKNLTDTLIRQHLNDSSQGSLVSPSTSKPVNKSLPSPSTPHYVSSSVDMLRKPTPKIQTVKITHTTQGKPTTPHIVTLHSSQNPVLFKPSPVQATPPVRPATSLLKSLMNQAHESATDYVVQPPERNVPRNTGPSSSQRSPNQGVSNSKGQGKHQWNQSPASLAAVQELQARLQSAAGMNPKPYTMTVANTQQIPGFQSVKVSSLTHEQLAAYQAQQMKAGISSSGSILSKQMPTPDSTK